MSDTCRHCGQSIGLLTATMAGAERFRVWIHTSNNASHCPGPIARKHPATYAEPTAKEATDE